MPRRHAADDSLPSPAIPVVRVMMECLVLALALFSPWAFGAETQGFLFWMVAGVAGVLLLWAARVLLEGRWSWRSDGISACLAGLFLISVLQTVSLPPFVLNLLSPRAVELQAELLPQQPEVLPLGEARLTSPEMAGAAISLYPARTREEAVKLLAVFLLYAAVQQNLTSTAALGRLALLATVNGALLSLFGLVQFFSTPSPQLVYWMYPSDGAVFGPFVCRNHFPFYVNICAGLCVGQMIAVRRLRSAKDETAWFVERSWWNAPFRLLHDPATLWLSIALTLMVTATLFSMSRGGTLSLLGSAGICLLIKLTQSRRVSQLETGVLIAVLVLGLATWFGFDAVQERLSTLWSGVALADGRVTYFWYGLRLWRQFPLVGTGLGTWGQVEPLQRQPGDNPWMISVHAHNDYIEALVEGGILRFALSLLAIFLVYRHAWHNLRRYRRRFEGGLFLGGVFGFTTVVLHSVVDFGLHVPAIAVLATVLAAQISARRHRRRRSATLSPLARRIAPWAAAGTLALLAIFLVTDALTAAKREGYRLTALNLSDPSNPGAVEQQRIYLEAAVRAGPSHPHVNIEYAEVLLARYQQELVALEPPGRAVQAAAAVLDGALMGSEPGAGLPGFTALARQLTARPPVDPAAQAELNRRFLTPALAHCLLARDLCPLLPEAQLWLAARVGDFERADPRAAYLQRATLVRPENPEFWYLLGEQQFKDGNISQAWASYRKSLHGGDRYLPQVLNRCRDEKLTNEEIISQVMPWVPERLLAAALALHPPPAPLAQRLPYLEKALYVLHRSWDGSAEESRMEGRLLKALGRPADAITSYMAAVALAPDKPAWRLELAQLLYQEGKLPEAREQLLQVLKAQPGHGDARALLEAVQRELAGQK